MKNALKVFVCILILGLHVSAFANLRERIKERWIKKQQENPAPTATADVGKKIEKSGTYTFTIRYADHDRHYIVHIPKTYNAAVSSPLLLALHGGGGDMSIQADDQFYKQISKSEAEGFIAVFPNGFSRFPSGKLATWNAGKCCGAARDEKIDDIGFLKTVIKNVSAQINIDSKRIFATGMSNGAMMVYRLACEMSDTIRAVAAVAGTDNTISCAPKNPIPILHIHAKDDDHVLFGGGAGARAFRDRSAVAEFTSVADTIAKWVKFNQCEGKATRILEVSGATCEIYRSCKAGLFGKTEVELCVTDKGGHSWPGGKKPRGGSSPSNAISANDVMWEFFRSK